MKVRATDVTRKGEGSYVTPGLKRRAGLRRVLGTSLCLATIGVLTLTAPALAATGHEFRSNISEAPPGTKLVEPSALTVVQSSGQVFVGDSGTGYIDVYDSSGKYLTRIGGGQLETAEIAVDEANGDVYVANPFDASVSVFEPDGQGGYRLLSKWSGQGTPNHEFGEITGVAFDNSNGPSAGDLYVVESETAGGGGGAVDVFKPKPNPEHPEEIEEEHGEEGQFLKRLAGPKLEAPNGIAVNGSTGRVLVADSVSGAIFAYSAAGTFEQKLTGKGSPYGTFSGGDEQEGNVAGLATVGASGDILVAESERHVVSQYSASGEWKGWITHGPSGPLGEPHGVALTASEEVYVADSSLGVVDLFGPGVPIPDVETGKLTKSKLTRTSAILSGTINGDGKPAKYRFEWGTSEALGSTTPSTTAGPGEELASATITGLQVGTPYFFRIVGENENGVNQGIIHEFTTLPAVEGVSTGPATNVEPTSAVLTGSLAPGGVDAHYYFEWGTTTAYGNTSPTPPGADAGAGHGTVAAETDLSGIRANTTYHYRLVAENEFGRTEGSDQQFTTSGPPRITNEATTGTGHEEATIHAAVNPDHLATTYHFEYGETTAYGSEVPLGGQAVGSGGVPVAVSASLTSLRIGVRYHFRVIASNEAGTTTGPDQTFTTVPPAPVDATFTTGVKATEATLNTLIDPLGRDTTFYFQYGTASCQDDPSACINVPVPPGKDIGAGTADVSEQLTLTGLKPQTQYFYRVLDSNSLGSTDGVERTFTTQAEASFALPDDRAWEMVSPPDKRGAPVEALTREGGLILASEDGSALTYVVDGALGEGAQGNRSPEWQQVLATRSQQGWSSQDISTPNSRAKGVTFGQAPEYQFFSPDLSLALVEPVGAGAEPPLAPGVTQGTSYLRDDITGDYTPLVDSANVAPGTQFGGQIHFVSASSDLSHVVIASKVALTGPSSAPGLYEWAAGKLGMISVLPTGAPAPGLVELGYFHVTANAVSENGSRVIWTTSEESLHEGHLYMRDISKGKTVQLDAAQGVGEPTGLGAAEFQSASSDGSRIFFTDKQRLTADSTAEAASGADKPDLYECEVIEVGENPACRLRDLTVDQNAGQHAAVQGLIFGASKDGSSVFLVAQGELANDENGNGEQAQAGKNNLYELHEQGGQWTTTFVAGLSTEDSVEWEGNRIADSAYLTARVSPNGRYLAYMSAASPTGYDNVDANPAANGARDEEVYLFDASTASLRCVSCNPSGARPAGVLDTNESGEGLGLLADRRKVWLGHRLGGSIPGWTAQNLVSALFQSRFLSDEGRLYFDSPDTLVPQAVNGKEDVYEYEPSGVGSCISSSGGCIALVSAGNSDRESAFIEATPSGSDVFFVTEARLLPQDTDTAFDIYDAHECTQASPCLNPPEATQLPCGETNSCRPALAPQQIPGGASGTGTFSGAGNIVAAAPRQKPKPTKLGAKRLTRAQQLARALKSCRSRYVHAKRKRAACERSAHKRYGKARGARNSRATRSKAVKTGARAVPR